jgi:hypothetical protein
MRNNLLKTSLAIIALAGFLATDAVAAADEAAVKKLKVSITVPAAGSSVLSPVRLVGKVSGGVPPYTYKWAIPGGTPSALARKTSRTQQSVMVSYAPRSYTIRLTVIDSKRTRAVGRRSFTILPDTRKSINSTSQKRATFAASPVVEQPFVNQVLYRILSANDLGMHCGDLDHRIASILPPFNVLHAQVIRTVATAGVPRQILTDSDVDVVYSAASNPKDPALLQAPTVPVFKTNFWDLNPNTPLPQPANPLAFDAYDPFYPPGILSPTALNPDQGLPAPDLAQLYPVGGGIGPLVAAQQEMPGGAAPFAANTPLSFARFDTAFPFFVSFPFGYRLSAMNWFSADGIPVAPVDDVGRKNSFPLMRVQAKTKNTNLTGNTGDLLASVDTVVPVSAESDCWRCHTSSVDGGNAQAACLPGPDGTGCPAPSGSIRTQATFPVAQAADDDPALPFEVRREWAADNNILHLHDAKQGTNLASTTPVVCQKCHYTPALDLAHVGPLGPGDTDANGRDQRVHRTNSRVMHTFHSQFTDLFDNVMPRPDDPERRITDPLTGKLVPVINALVLEKLNNSCYQCHPGRNTKCLRGAMFNGGLVCFDCHGTMQQVGDDFSENFPTNPFPSGPPVNKRIPWANEPKCQSCHTGDALDNLTTDPNVIPSTDGIHLLQAYRTNDASATPIVTTNKRFAENDANTTVGPPAVIPVLYRLSKGHGGVFCEGCHGSTHAEWPVQPDSGVSVANDNMAALKLQLHTGKIIECTACHVGGGLPISGPTALDGPHGMHVVGNQTWMSGSHGPLVACPPTSNQDLCRTCHGLTGEGTVLSKAAIRRAANIDARDVVTCTTCHPWNPLDSNNIEPLPFTPVCN